MIFLVNGPNRRQFAADLEQMHRHRKTVFVDRAGWNIPVVGDQEIDGYDGKDTLYLLSKDEPEGPLLASVRLLPTLRPHLMGDLFAAACREGPPHGAAIWEASRFCTTPELPNRGIRLALLWETICGVMETALLCGIDQIIFAANRALLPLALSCGWEAKTLGEGLSDGEDRVTAVAAKISTGGLRRVRQMHGVPIPVLRIHASTAISSLMPRALDRDIAGTSHGGRTLPYGLRTIERTRQDRPSLGEPTRG